MSEIDAVVFCMTFSSDHLATIKAQAGKKSRMIELTAELTAQ